MSSGCLGGDGPALGSGGKTPFGPWSRRLFVDTGTTRQGPEWTEDVADRDPPEQWTVSSFSRPGPDRIPTPNRRSPQVLRRYADSCQWSTPRRRSVWGVGSVCPSPVPRFLDTMAGPGEGTLECGAFPEPRVSRDPLYKIRALDD